MQTIEQAKDSMTVKRVDGEPLEKGGVTVIPAARVQGGAGGGGGEGPQGEGRGSGSGFGINAKPVGAFVIRGDEVANDRTARTDMALHLHLSGQASGRAYPGRLSDARAVRLASPRA